MANPIKSKQKKAGTKVPKKASNPIPTVWGHEGYVITRDKRKSVIPMKRPSSEGYSVRRGYTYTIQRPDGTRLQRKGYSIEDAEALVKADMSRRRSHAGKEEGEADQNSAQRPQGQHRRRSPGGIPLHLGGNAGVNDRCAPQQEARGRVRRRAGLLHVRVHGTHQMGARRICPGATGTSAP